MSEKVYITAQSLLDDSYRLAIKVLEDGFRPDFIVGIWRGGTPVGIAVQELLQYFGIPTDHISIRTSSYSSMTRSEGAVAVHGLGYVIRNIDSEDSLLIVDDVYDTGLSVKAVIDTLYLKARKNTPHDIRIATPYFKPGKNRTDRVPNYYIHETEDWLVFPHELQGLTVDEIHENKPSMAELLKGVEALKSYQ
ncbi:MAG: phosphoribosyltransferase family protein [Pseudomonadota bacterium]